MNISSFTDFIAAAKSQPEPQRLLFVFTESEAAPGQASGGSAGQQRGTLTPVMCVDKLPDELASFAGLLAESQRTGQHWDVVFAAALSGQAGVAPASDAAELPLKKMIDAIQQGAIGNFLAFDRAGELVQFT